MLDFFVKVQDGDYSLTIASYIILGLITALLVVVALFLTKKKDNKTFSTKQLVFCGVAMALAIVTSFIKVYEMPMGGSITLLSMAFICLIGYLYGAKVSILVAIAYGLLQLIIKPDIYHPIQLILDYPVAFGALGLSGFFWKSKNGLIKGYLVGIIGRFLIASISGYIFFGAYAPEGWNPILYSLVYNGSYIFAEGLITIVLLCLPPVKAAFEQVKKMAHN